MPRKKRTKSEKIKKNTVRNLVGRVEVVGIKPKRVQTILKEYMQHVPEKFMIHELDYFRQSMFVSIKMDDHGKTNWREEKAVVENLIALVRGAV